METILKVPYNYSDPNHDYDASDEIIMDQSNIASVIAWEKSKKEHEQKLVEAYKKYKPMNDRTINRLGCNIAINNEGPKEKTNFKQQQTYFTETKAIIRNMNNQEISIDELLEYHTTQEPFIIDIQLPIYEKNEDLEPEVKAWIRETIRINREIDEAEDRLRGFSKRDFRIEFPNSKSSALLKDTNMVDIVNNHTFMFLVDRIIFSK